jgi:ketosteroid isomerase-like protein
VVSQEQISLLRYSLESTDFDTLPLLYHDDMELHESGPVGGVHKGLAAYTAYFRQLFEEVEYLWTKVDEMNADGDWVLVYTSGELRDRRTNATMRMQMGILFGFRDDRIALVEPFVDRGQAYERWRIRTESESPHSAVAPDLTDG